MITRNEKYVSFLSLLEKWRPTTSPSLRGCALSPVRFVRADLSDEKGLVLELTLVHETVKTIKAGMLRL